MGLHRSNVVGKTSPVEECKVHGQLGCKLTPTVLEVEQP